MDYCNPTPDDLIAWAFDADADLPTQDWDLLVIGDANLDVIFELAGNESCPQCDFFVGCLYTIVELCVDSGGATNTSPKLSMWLDAAKRSASPTLRRWATRSADFLSNPLRFDRSSWRSGGWSLDDQVLRQS